MSESSVETMLMDTGIIDSTSGESLTYEVTYDPSITDPDSLGIVSFSSSDSPLIRESVVSQALSDVGVSAEQQDAILTNLAQEFSSSITYERLSEILVEAGVPKEQELGILTNIAYSYDSTERLSQILLDSGLSPEETVGIVLNASSSSDSSASIEQLSQVLLDQGLSEEQVAGILTNTQGSSGFSTSLLSGSGDLVMPGDIVSDFLGALGYLGSSPIFVIGISILAAVLSIEIAYSSIKRAVKSDSWVVTDQDTQEMINSVNESLSKYYPMLE